MYYLGQYLTSPPYSHVGKLMSFVTERRGELLDHVVLGGDRTMLKYVLPMSELGGNFYDELKSITSGFASFDYEEGWSANCILQHRVLQQEYIAGSCVCPLFFHCASAGEYREADLVRLDVLVNGELVDALARIVHRDKAARTGRQLVEKLKVCATSAAVYSANVIALYILLC